jgi:heptosyltransferase-2
MKSKIWPPDRFNALCQRLLAHDPRFYFLLLGDKSEYLHGEPIRKGLEIASLNLSGKTSIIESATALQRCAAYIGNDTGTMHLAAAMGVPVVAIFSAIDSPGKWEPYGDKNTVIRKNVECEGCMLTTCVDQKMMCLNLISVDEVYEASLARLQSTYYPGMEEARGPKAEAY